MLSGTHVETNLAAKKLFPHLKLITGRKEGNHPKLYYMFWKVVQSNDRKNSHVLKLISPSAVFLTWVQYDGSIVWIIFLLGFDF